MAATVLITGANRGVGLGLVRSFLARGCSVLAACRQPERASELHALVEHNAPLRIYTCDVASDSSVQALAQAVAQNTRAIDVLVNNAGVLPRGDDTIATVDIDVLRHTVETNAYGALRVTQALLPLLRKGQGKKILHISTRMGSLSLNSAGGSYSYRISKAALNMLHRTLAIELRSEGIISVAVHPGWVQTDMGGAQATVPLADSLRGLMSLVDTMTIESSGGFFNYTGEPLAY